MRKFFAYPLTCIYYLFFGLSLLIFHPVQWICLNVFGYQAHKKSVDYLNLCLTRCLHLLGIRFSFKVPKNLPKNVPVIVVSNHQSMNDIPPIIWFMRRFHLKFISKKELGKGIPSVSYNLRNSGSVLIDRKDPRQAVNLIKQIGAYIETHNRGVVIFPEGTRSRDGLPKPFQARGLATLIEASPNAYIFPVTINNSWKTLMYGKFPMGVGAHLKYKIHQPLKISDFDDTKTLIAQVENTIKKDIIVG